MSLAGELSLILGRAFAAEGLPEAFGQVQPSDRPDLAQFQCNGALAAAKAAKANPRAIAEKIAARLKADPLFAKVEIAGPGFLNLDLITNNGNHLYSSILFFYCQANLCPFWPFNFLNHIIQSHSYYVNWFGISLSYLKYNITCFKLFSSPGRPSGNQFGDFCKIVFLLQTGSNSFQFPTHTNIEFLLFTCSEIRSVRIKTRCYGIYIY